MNGTGELVSMNDGFITIKTRPDGSDGTECDRIKSRDGVMMGRRFEDHVFSEGSLGMTRG